MILERLRNRSQQFAEQPASPALDQMKEYLRQMRDNGEPVGADLPHNQHAVTSRGIHPISDNLGGEPGNRLPPYGASRQ